MIGLRVGVNYLLGPISKIRQRTPEMKSVRLTYPRQMFPLMATFFHARRTPRKRD